MKNRFTTMLLAAALALTVFAAPVFASDTENIGPAVSQPAAEQADVAMNAITLKDHGVTVVVLASPATPPAGNVTEYPTSAGDQASLSTSEVTADASSA